MILILNLESICVWNTRRCAANSAAKLLIHVVNRSMLAPQACVVCANFSSCESRAAGGRNRVLNHKEREQAGEASPRFVSKQQPAWPTWTGETPWLLLLLRHNSRLQIARRPPSGPTDSSTGAAAAASQRRRRMPTAEPAPAASQPGRAKWVGPSRAERLLRTLHTAVCQEEFNKISHSLLLLLSTFNLYIVLRKIYILRLFYHTTLTLLQINYSTIHSIYAS